MFKGEYVVENITVGLDTMVVTPQQSFFSKLSGSKVDPVYLHKFTIIDRHGGHMQTLNVQQHPRSSISVVRGIDVVTLTSGNSVYYYRRPIEAPKVRYDNIRRVSRAFIELLIQFNKELENATDRK
jgi:hypothetical protein